MKTRYAEGQNVALLRYEEGGLGEVPVPGARILQAED